MQYQAVIFDMDGTLIDSELYWHDAEMFFLSKYNIKLTPDHAKKVVGRSLRESVEMLKKDYGITASVEQLLREKNQASESIYSHRAQAMPGAEALVKRLKAAGHRVAVASGSSLDRITMIFDRLGWGNLFDLLVSTDHVDYKGKPDPAIYTYTLQKLGVKPAKAIALEDSANGVRSAQQAGMRCVAVPDKRWDFSDTSFADYQVSSLEDPALYVYLGL